MSIRGDSAPSAIIYGVGLYERYDVGVTMVLFGNGVFGNLSEKIVSQHKRQKGVSLKEIL